MRTFTGWIPGLIVTLLLTAAASAESLDDPVVLETYIDGVVRPLMKTNNSPSGTVAIAKDGELIFAKGYGFENVADRTPVDPYTTLFRPGSTSKLFTWTGVMQLVEQGKLDLDTNVNEYLDTFQIKDTFDEPITLRHIMTHTTGFEDGGLGYLIIDDPENAIPLREAMERYQPERVNPPGVQTAYSNYATALAGLIIEQVSDVPFNEYIKENIFDPLGMNNSSFAEPLPPDLAEHMAASYKVEAGAYAEQPFEIIANFAPAGAQSATATDMVRFGQAMLNGGELDGNRILQTGTTKRMLTREFSHDERLMGMALGFYEIDINGYRVLGHGGDTQWFHSYLGIDEANSLTFFVSFSGNGGSTVRSAFADALYNKYFPREESPPAPPEGFAERAGKYAGTYRFWRGNFSKVESVFRITSTVEIAPTEDDTLMLAFAGNSKQYVEVEENLFRELNSNLSLIAGISPPYLAFQENEEGDVTGFVMDGLPFMSLYKVPGYTTSSFNFTLLGISLLVFLGVVLRRFYQRRELALLPDADRAALGGALYASIAHLLVVVVGAIVVSIVMERLIAGFPLPFKLWLVLPIIATLASLYLVYRAFLVWRGGLLAGVWARIRFTIVVLCALFMCWFYWFWNILGFQYL
jgi:CubicO group peptidase (beta-lactamase class C family)